MILLDYTQNVRKSFHFSEKKQQIIANRFTKENLKMYLDDGGVNRSRKDVKQQN